MERVAFFIQRNTNATKKKQQNARRPAEGHLPWPGVLLVGEIAQSPTLPGKMTFRVAISTETDPQGTGRVDIHTHPYTTAACAAWVVTKTTDRDSSRYTYNGTRRVRQLALGCESN